jgi:hypothetical protein
VILLKDDCAQSGLHKILIRTSDTDALVLAIGHFQKMTATELWIVFGCGQNFKYITTHYIANFPGPGKACTLLVIHVFTGCDTVSFFAGRTKQAAWNT